MSANADKPVWPLWRWLLVGTVFALFCPSLFVLSAILILYGIVSLFLGSAVLFALSVLGGGLLFAVWRWQRWFFRQIAAGRNPQSFIACLLPVFIPVWYVQMVGAVFFFFAFDAALFALFPYFPVLLPFTMFGGAIFVFWCAMVVASLIALRGGYELVRAVRGATGLARGIGLLLSVTAALSLVCAAAYGQYRTHVLKQDRAAQTVRDEKSATYDTTRSSFRDETDLSEYVPFSLSNKLVSVESPGLCIMDDPPRLHGALALYPVYAAAAQALFPEQSSWRVKGGTSPAAFNALLADEERLRHDMAFMLYPSEKQLALAHEKGKTLEITKIGREAFVFFVSHVNPVDNLTSAQIRDIYGRRVTNWSAVGGKDERILPFQRPEGSGSQTAMERFMGDAPLAKPVQEEFQLMMGGIVNRVADYRNYGNAIGFSFRYYVEGMFKHDGVKLLTVDGIAPTAENIRNGTYPLVADVVIVTAGSTNPNVKKLTDWFLSPKGQELLEKVGYVPLQGEP